MFSIINNVENKIVCSLDSIQTITKIKEICIENGDDFSIIDMLTAKQYIEEFCDNLDLVDIDGVDTFLTNHAVEVEENEPANYVELMMDNHKCVSWKNKSYYISDSLVLQDDEEQKIYDVLVQVLHA
jgi:hypothetical protein